MALAFSQFLGQYADELDGRATDEWYRSMSLNNNEPLTAVRLAGLTAELDGRKAAADDIRAVMERLPDFAREDAETLLVILESGPDSISEEDRTRIAKHHGFLGELALDGSLHPVPGVVAAALAVQQQGRKLALSDACAARAAQVPGSCIIGAPDLLTLCAHLNASVPITAARPTLKHPCTALPDLGEVVGQPAARRALEIAASGGHNLLFWGPPGTGKTLLASRLTSILPPMTPGEALESLALRDTSHQTAEKTAINARPFRNPHHSASAAALVGGGSKPQPGEVSLAHGGVLFLDELPEFNRNCLEVLREPLESGEITLSRARYKVTYPARFQLVAAMNPCPCGHLGDHDRPCQCAPTAVQQYRSRISGPLLDRIDIQVQVSRLPAGALVNPPTDAECSVEVRERVVRARERQMERQGCVNGALPHQQLLAASQLSTGTNQYLIKAADSLHLSGRGLYRTLRVARTLADMAGSGAVSTENINEALAYRDSVTRNA